MRVRSSLKIPQQLRFASAKASAPPAYLASQPATELNTLTNGVRVASQTGAGETASIDVWIDSGSRNESVKHAGAANFVRHLALKGTKGRNEQQLRRDIEGLGGKVSVTVGRERTLFSAKVFKADVPKAVELIADMIRNPALDAKGVDQARSQLLAEIKAAEYDYESWVQDHLHETAFMGTALGRPVYGSEEAVAKLSSGDLAEYVQANHTSGGRVVVTGSGALDQKQLLELSEKHFGALAAPSGAKKEGAVEPAMFTGSDKRIRFDSMGVAHVALAFQTGGNAPGSSQHVLPLMLMQTLLGQWSNTDLLGRHASSRFLQNVADSELAFRVKAFNHSYKDTGLFGMYLAAPDNQLDNSLWALTDNLVRLCHDVTDEEVAVAKAQLQRSVSASRQCSGDVGRQILAHGRHLTAAETYIRIDNLTADDVKSTADTFLNDEDHALSAVGPIYELPDYNWIRRRSHWVRY